MSTPRASARLVILGLVGLGAAAALDHPPPAIDPATWTPAAVAPRSAAHLDTATATAQTLAFRAQVSALEQDLVRMTAMPEAERRMVSIAVVTAALENGVPPALVLGTMLVESDARVRGCNYAGACGLMQVRPAVWTPALGRYLGEALDRDSVNIAYGAAVLGIYARESAGDWSTLLLRYNGCTGARISTRCLQYPAKVQRAVGRGAITLCAGREFEACVAAPLRSRAAQGDR